MAEKLDLIPASEWGFFTPPEPMVIAGPCSAESEEQVLETARGLASFGIHMFRAGIWKPRTHPGCFEGVGKRGLKEGTVEVKNRATNEKTSVALDDVLSFVEGLLS